jgi:sarcosine oxidase subunit alpha
MITISIDGVDTEVEEGISIAAALINAGVWSFRTSVAGAPRGPICAMGICFECRVTLDGHAHRRACMENCSTGMEVHTGG